MLSKLHHHRGRMMRLFFVSLLTVGMLGIWNMSPLRPARALSIIVNNTNDAGAGSLRQAVLDANGSAGSDTITFSLPNPSTITLTTGQIVINGDTTITGLAPTALTVSGNNASRVFRTAPGTIVNLSN